MRNGGQSVSARLFTNVIHFGKEFGVIPWLLLQGGKTIRDLCSVSGATTIDLSRDDSMVRISGPTEESITKAQSLVLLLAGETAPGTIIRQARVERVSAFGAFVEVAPSKAGLVHVSEVAVDPVRNVEDVLKVCGMREYQGGGGKWVIGEEGRLYHTRGGGKGVVGEEGRLYHTGRGG